MKTALSEAQLQLQKAREALGRGDRTLARQHAERAAKLAPQLEDSWLVLAAVAGPRLGLEYIQKALQANPDSPRARRGMEWAMQHLGQQGQDATAPQAARRGPARRPSPPPATPPRKAARRGSPRILLSLTLLILGCAVLGLAGWTAMSSPAVAAMINEPFMTPEPAEPAQWAQASIPKPTYTLPAPIEDAPIAASPPVNIGGAPTDEGPIVPPVFATDVPTEVPTVLPTEPDVPTAEPTWSGSLSMEYVENTPTPAAPPYVPPTAAVPGDIVGGTHWIDVDLSQQMLYAYAGDTVVNSFLVSTGVRATPTVTGKFKIWIKLRYSDMSGPDYYLPDVPYVMYFYKDYGLHGTYWHNNFGTPMSHGCVNLSIPDAEWLYNFAYEGTVVNVHY